MPCFEAIKATKTRKHKRITLDPRRENRLKPIPPELNNLGREIVDAAYKVHRGLGPGLLEKIYEVCLCHELSKKRNKQHKANSHANYIRRISV